MASSKRGDSTSKKRFNKRQLRGDSVRDRAKGDSVAMQRIVHHQSAPSKMINVQIVHIEWAMKAFGNLIESNSILITRQLGSKQVATSSHACGHLAGPLAYELISF